MGQGLAAGWFMWAALAALSLGGAALRDPATAGMRDAPLTIAKPHRRPPAPLLRAPLEPGAPIPWSGSPLLTPQTLSIVDEDTRFLVPGGAEARCPGAAVVFVPGVVNPYRPTVPGDGAFLCRADAVAQGFVGP